jgi:hypothetical protein
MLAVIVAVLLPPVLRVSVNAAVLAVAFCAIVVLAGVLEAWPVVVWLTVMLLPLVFVTVLWLASISLTLAVKDAHRAHPAEAQRSDRGRRWCWRTEPGWSKAQLATSGAYDAAAMSDSQRSRYRRAPTDRQKDSARSSCTSASA